AQLAGQLCRRHTGVDPHLGQRVRRAERRHGKCQGWRGGGFCAEAQRYCDTRLNGRHLRLESFLFGENPLGPYDEPFTLGREALIVVPPVDQCDVELALELGDRCRERRLRHVACLRGPGEVSLARHRDEILQLAEQHQRLVRAGGSESAYSCRRLTAIASCVLRAITITAGRLGSGFSSRCGTYGGTKT